MALYIRLDHMPGQTNYAPGPILQPQSYPLLQAISHRNQLEEP